MSRFLLNAFRRDVEAEMTSTCTITRPSPQPQDFNPDTGRYTYPDPVIVYEGKCFVRPVSRQDRVEETGEGLVTLRLYELRLPLRLTGLQVNDQVTITATADGELDGAVLRVRDVGGDDWAVARNVIVEEREGR